MNQFRLVHLLVLFTMGQISLTVLYAVQTARGAGLWLVLAVLALLTLSLVVLTVSVWQRARIRRYIHRYHDTDEPTRPRQKPSREPSSPR